MTRFSKTFGALVVAFVCATSIATVSHAQVATQEAPAKDAAKEKAELPSAESVLDRYMEVTGGIEKYKAMKTMASKAEMSIPMAGIKGKVSIYQDFENERVYTKAVLPGAGNEESGSDGTTCWSISPMMGGAMLLEGTKADQIKEQASMKTVYDYKNAYKAIEVLGEEKVEDEKCYKLEFTKHGDSKETKFFSADSGLLIKSILSVDSPLGVMRVEVLMEEYRTVEGFTVPTKVVQALPNGMKIEVTMDTKDIKINGEIKDKVFALPKDVEKLAEAKEKSDTEKSDKEKSDK